MGHRDDERAAGYHRRTVLGAVGGGLAGVASPGASAQSPSPSPGGDRLELAWANEYGSDRYLVLRDAVQAADGGFAFGGEGVPEESPTHPQLALVRTDAAGEVQWRAFADDGIEGTYQESRAVVRTRDGGFVVAGFGRYPDEPETYRAGTRVAEAAKFAADGRVEWVRSYDAYEPDDGDDDAPDPGKEDRAMAFAAAPAPDGGVVVAGFRNEPPWAAKLAADGSLDWELTYPERNAFVDVYPEDGGFVLVANPSGNDPYHAVHVSATGERRRTVALDVDYESVTSNHVVVPVAGGGYAYTGRTLLGRDMVLARLDADGARQWTRFYDGPGHWSDWAHDVVQTRDGGFALAGFMSESPEADPRPALVKTDPEGHEQYRRVLTERRAISGDTGFSEVVETDDGGFVALAMPWVVRFSPGDGSPPATTVRTDTPTPTTGDGPGFGVLGTVAGAAGLLGLRRLRGD